ncbi:AMP-binding protein [Mameliella alba]|nr:AMP-binding protein [Antarctobacter heliothermus]MBY6145185.1 AMP-binding protein [Mameliella alba]MCA0954933.1 AMP-binding protein [Mameliella alba]
MTGDVISGKSRTSRAEILAQARRGAAGLQAIGAGGGRIALLLRNGAPFVTAVEAARLADAVAVPINWHFSAPEIEYVLADSGVSALVVHADIWNRIRSQLSPSVLARLAVLCVEPDAETRAAYRLGDDEARFGSGCRSWDSFCADHDPIGESTGKPAFPLIYTSGTTGNPKGVCRRGKGTPTTHGYDAFFQGDMVTLISAPTYHSAPIRFCSQTFAKGGTLVLPARFDAEDTLALIEKHRVTDSFMVPTMINRMLRLPEDVRARYDLSSLRHVVTAGAPFPPEMKEQVVAWWGPVVYEYYGSTETGALTFATSAEARERPGTVGRALPVARLAILDENRNPLPPGEPGEIFGARSDYPPFEYLNRPEATAEVYHDGLLTSGDVGYLDEDGYLFLNDRKRDMIIAGGVNIYPAHIEAALSAHPQVLDCAVFGIPDPDLGEAVAAAIQTPDGTPPDLDDIRAFLAERVAKYMIPRHFDHETTLPRDPSGKIVKRKLRDPYWDQQKRAI